MQTFVRQMIDDYLNQRPSTEEVQSLQLRPFPVGGQNKKLLGTSASATWVMKFCRNNQGKVPEICNREAMTSLLGKALGVPVIPAWVLPVKLINGCPIRQNEEQDLILDQFVLMPFLDGKTLEENRIGWSPQGWHAIADMLAFLHWIGDEDRGLSDVMIQGDSLVLIDNGLCGPGSDKKLRGYHPTPEVYSDERIILKCYGGGKHSFVEFLLKDSEAEPCWLAAPSVLKRLETLDDAIIEEIVDTTEVSRTVSSILIERKRAIARDYASWLEEASTLCGQ